MPKRSLRNLPPEERPFPVRGYLWLNFAFWVLCILIYLAAGLFQRGETAGLIPVLAGLVVCFALVCLYDAVFDRTLLRKVSEESRQGKREDDKDTRPGAAPASSSGSESP